MTSKNPHLSKWDLRWIRQAEEVKTWSKDPSTKVGCIFVRNNRLVSSGYNGFPSGILDSEIRLNDREFKNKIIVHAERNAIAWAAKEGVSTNGCTAYVTFHPCCGCASLLIEVGVEKIVCPSPLIHSGRWKEDFAVSSDILLEANIPVLYYEL